MNKSYILKELVYIGIRSDGVKVKRCILCKSTIKEPDFDCPVCRVIMHIKSKDKKD